jgi:hypothetical protein
MGLNFTRVGDQTSTYPAALVEAQRFHHSKTITTPTKSTRKNIYRSYLKVV